MDTEPHVDEGTEPREGEDSAPRRSLLVRFWIGFRNVALVSFLAEGLAKWLAPSFQAARPGRVQLATFALLSVLALATYVLRTYARPRRVGTNRMIRS